MTTALIWKSRIVGEGERPAIEFTANPANFRLHPDSQRQALRGSLSDLGWIQRVIVNRTTGNLIDGHARVEEALLLGNDTPVPFTEVELSEEEEALALTLLDPISAEAETSRAKLEMLLHRTSSGNAAVMEFLTRQAEKHGIVPPMGSEGSSGEPADAEPQIDRAAELNEKWKVKPSDLWLIGEHRLLCGDSTKAEDVARVMGGEKADLLMTDPPYNVAYTGKTKDALTIDNDEMSDPAFRGFLVQAFTAAFDSLKAGGAFYIWHADSEGYNFRGAVFDIGQKVRQCLIWAKNTLVMGRQDYHWKHEPCLYGWKEGAAHSWHSDRTQTTLLQFDRPTSSQEHPTMKPVALFEYLIRNSSGKGEIVLDTFGGSGTTLVAAQNTERKGRTVELSPNYCAVILERMATAFPSLEIRRA